MRFIKPCKIPQNKTTRSIFKKGGPSITLKKGGPEAIASLASPNIHHCCNTLSTTATAIDIKAVVECFFETNGLSWLNFKHVCTDGGPAMVGAKGRFVSLVKNEWPHVTSSHCLLHRYALATKTLPTPLMEVMDVAVKIINFIRVRAKTHQLFQILAKKMGAKHLGLLYQTKFDGYRGVNAFLGCMNSTIKWKHFFWKTKTIFT